ncbi:hypothetical protein [Candidatus Nephthysia bennettiae]|uniref:Uncharacterized protein n=1 Tax=Candidatus Nephthysia bennettiae TaxID=3127016 RepID=A0A934K6T7_9BACT|nr:hypothetical protein [Candidatus Dormibacteraeota bacterium]MBJ7611153.1 hypothetical protein [Candidatus Dormibacteraeota bacterium]
MLGLLQPGLLVGVLLVLVLSQVLYAVWPYRRRSYLPALLVTALGVLLGQVWDVVGLPALRLGEANLLPAVIFAIALQPLADRLPIRFP